EVSLGLGLRRFAVVDGDLVVLEVALRTRRVHTNGLTQLRRNGVAGAHLGTRALAPILAEQRVLQLGDPRVAVGVGNLVDLGDLDALDLDPELLEKQEELLEGADAESL